MARTLIPGKIARFSVDGTQQLDYFAYLPQRWQPGGPVFITVHGISRNAEEHLQGFAAQAEQYGALMIAPLFTAADFPRYQRLGSSVHEGRSDLAFDQVLQDARTRFAIDPFPLKIFGFSGGGQFAHRYAMFYPKRVDKQVLGAPGWYTFPDPNRSYPIGLRSSKEWPRLKFSPGKFLQIPTLVMVGEDDNLRDEDLNKSRQIEAFQGLNRIERGERWVNAQRALARAYNVAHDFRFEVVPKANHAYESYVAHPQFAEQVFRFLFETAP